MYQSTFLRYGYFNFTEKLQIFSNCDRQCLGFELIKKRHKQQQNNKTTASTTTNKPLISKHLESLWRVIDSCMFNIHWPRPSVLRMGTLSLIYFSFSAAFCMASFLRSSAAFCIISFCKVKAGVSSTLSLWCTMYVWYREVKNTTHYTLKASFELTWDTCTQRISSKISHTKFFFLLISRLKKKEFKANGSWSNKSKTHLMFFFNKKRCLVQN